MYEELYGTKIEQLVILIAGEDGTMVPFIKERKPYEEKLGKSIQDFYKYYEEINETINCINFDYSNANSILRRR